MRGYKCIIVMPENMSEERKMLISAYGASLVLTPAADGMDGAIAKANELLKEIKGSIIAGQFTNPANPKAHYDTTGREIFDDTDGYVDIFVCGVGTGGTITGTGRYLKEKKGDIKVVAVDTTSAGDTLCGGLSVGLARGYTLEEACAYGSKAASIACTRKGAQISIPTEQEVLNFKQN